MRSDSDQVISLFAGAGGLSQGLAFAGCKPFAGVEIDEDARSTYEENLGIPCHALDLAQVSASELRVKLGVKGSPLAIVGGPPCQGFSSAGGRDSSDPRNRLIFNYLHIVEALNPRWFVFENVEGLLTANDGASLFKLAGAFSRIGYAFRIEKVNFAGFGVPQARKRVIIVGNRLGLDFTFPDYSHSYDAGKHRWGGSLPASPVLSRALAGLPKPSADPRSSIGYATASAQNQYDERMRQGNTARALTHHHASEFSVRDIERMSALLPGQTMKDLPEHLWHDSFRRRAFRRVMDGTPTERRGGAPSGLKRLRGDLNSLTITGAATQEFVHPFENRTLTLRECARIQSFPDAYRFSGSSRSVAQQIGNAVPPIGAEVLGRMILGLDGVMGSGKSVSLRGAGLIGFHLTDSAGMSPALSRTHSLLASLIDRLKIESSKSEEASIAERQAS